jgi:hypothetical protein
MLFNRHIKNYRIKFRQLLSGYPASIFLALDSLFLILFYNNIIYTVLVFGINITYIYYLLTFKAMSRELIDFSTLIDEQFEIAIFDEESLADYLLNLFS